MSTPSSASVPPTINIKEVSRELESFQQVDSTRQRLLEHLLRRLSELDTSLQAAKSDLEDQNFIRRQWKKRAEVAEASLVQNQFVLALIDGNRYTFADSYLKNTEMGGADAGRDLVGQIRSYLHERKVHDDPAKVTLMVHIFANKTALSQALIDSGTISGPGQFDEFITQFMRSQPFLYFVDCGPSEGAVDSKIQESYEFHFDNAHCKHLLLALRHESGYITELDTYRADESTLARTSLMRSSHAVVGKFASTFHFANTPALGTIALISLEHPNGTSAEKDKEVPSSVVRTRVSTRNHDLHGLFEVEDQKSRVTERNGVDRANENDLSGRESDSSITSKNTAASRDGEAADPPEPRKPLYFTQETKKSTDVMMAHVMPVHHSNTSPYLGSVHSYMNDWENAPSSDIYTPPPDPRPWDHEHSPSWDDTATAENKGIRTEKATDRASSREATINRPVASERASSDKRDHQHHSKGALTSLALRKGRETPKVCLPPSRNPGDVADFVPEGGQVLYSQFLESKFSSPPGETSAVQLTDSTMVAINQYGQRIDLTLPRPSADSQARYTSRWHAKKLCNDHHLREGCGNQDCRFDHDPIDEGVRLALRIAARNIACKHGVGCRRQNCIHGHHCPHRLNPGGCKKAQCVFNAKGMHAVDDLTIERVVQGR